MRLTVVSVLLVAGLVVAAYLVVPGPVSRSYLHASIQRETGGGGAGDCQHVRGPRWRCRVGRKVYAVRMRDHACWTARGEMPGPPVKGCIHLLEPKVFS